MGNLRIVWVFAKQCDVYKIIQIILIHCKIARLLLQRSIAGVSLQNNAWVRESKTCKMGPIEQLGTYIPFQFVSYPYRKKVYQVQTIYRIQK